MTADDVQAFAAELSFKTICPIRLSIAGYNAKWALNKSRVFIAVVMKTVPYFLYIHY